MSKTGITITGIVLIIAVTLIACLVETFSYRSWSAGMELTCTLDEDEESE